MERQTSVSDGVLVRALVTLSGVPQQNRPRDHQLSAKRRAILKRTSEHERDRMLSVPLFERAVPRPEGADDFEHRPAVSLRHYPRTRTPASLLAIALIRTCESNFRQDLASFDSYD